MSNDQKLLRALKLFLAMLSFTVVALPARPMADTLLHKVRAVADANGRVVCGGIGYARQ